MAKYYPNLTKQIKQPIDLGNWAKSKQDKFKEKHPSSPHSRIAEKKQRKYHKYNLSKKIHCVQGKECLLTTHQKETKRQWNSIFKVLIEKVNQEFYMQ